jgi:hypothetical protein
VNGCRIKLLQEKFLNIETGNNILFVESNKQAGNDVYLNIIGNADWFGFQHI